MDRVAVFVDAGYVFAQGSVLLSGQKQPRGDLRLHAVAALQALTAFAESTAALPLLRIYWYDGTSVGPTAQHTALAHLPSVKVRLGFVNRAGEQKGVDSLIVTDMISLARNRGMADAVLVSGDEDLRVGVQQAQEFGVRVHLLGIEPSRGNQSQFLLQEADTCHEWTASDVAAFLAYVPRDAQAKHATPVPSGVVAPQGSTGHPYDAVIRETALELSRELLPLIVLGYKAAAQIPREVDAKLLARARRVLSRDLEPREKKDLRIRFISFCERRVTGPG